MVITLASGKGTQPEPDLHMPMLPPEAQELCEPGIPQYVCICANWLPRHPKFIQLLHPAWLQKACRQAPLSMRVLALSSDPVVSVSGSTAE